MKSVNFCVPWYDEWDDVKASLCRLDVKWISERVFIVGDIVNVTITDGRGTNCYDIRNIFVSGTLDIAFDFPKILDFDEWIFCDSDISFSQAQMETILNHDKDIISLAYESDAVEQHYNARMAGNFVPLSQAGVIKVQGSGAGFLKVKRRVFEKMSPYWFFPSFSIKENGILRSDSEDYTFCLEAIRAGFDIWVDFDNPVMHRINKSKQLREARKMEKKEVTTDEFIDQQIENLFIIKRVIKSQGERIRALEAENLPKTPVKEQLPQETQ